MEPPPLHTERPRPGSMTSLRSIVFALSDASLHQYLCCRREAGNINIDARRRRTMRRQWIAGLSLILAVAVLCGVAVAPSFAGWTAFIPPQVSDDWTLNQVSFPVSNEGWAV